MFLHICNLALNVTNIQHFECFQYRQFLLHNVQLTFVLTFRTSQCFQLGCQCCQRRVQCLQYVLIVSILVSKFTNAPHSYHMFQSFLFCPPCVNVSSLVLHGRFQLYWICSYVLNVANRFSRFPASFDIPWMLNGSNKLSFVVLKVPNVLRMFHLMIRFEVSTCSLCSICALHKSLYELDMLLLRIVNVSQLCFWTCYGIDVINYMSILQQT